MKKVGHVQMLFRHPVKAMRGEQLQTCRVDRFGFYGDRSHYFLDESRGGRYLSADRVPALLGYQATMPNECGGEQYPPVQVVARDGSVHDWGESLFAHVHKTVGGPVRPVRSTPQEGGKNWEDHILLVTDASLREIARLAKVEPLDPRRFRANLVIALDEDAPFAEDAWIGKQLRVNDVMLKVSKPCDRCMYVNIDPDTLAINPAVLKACHQHHGNAFGVYASVVAPGTVSAGDAVFLAE